MVQAGTLPSRQLLLKAATLLLTAVQPRPKPADVRTFQLRKAWRKGRERETEEKGMGFLSPSRDDYCFIAIVIYYLLSYCINQAEL